MGQVSLLHLLSFLRYSIRKFWKLSIFRPFFSCIYRRTNIAIFVRFSNRDFAPQMTSERETAIMFVVFLPRYKLVKEFPRYHYSSRNGAIPNISPKTTKNDPTLEPPGGRTFQFGWSHYSIPNNFFHPSYNGVGLVPKFRTELQQQIRPFWSHRKIRTSVRPEVEIGDQRPSTGWYPERFPIDPENFGFLSDQVLEILGKMTFLLTRAPPGDGVENQKSVLQFWRYPRGAQIRERTSRNSVGKCSVPALHPPKTWKE